MITKEKKREYDRRYYLKHKEKVEVYRKEWIGKNRGQYEEKKFAWYLKNKNDEKYKRKKREQAKRWRENNPKTHKESQRKQYQKNPEKYYSRMKKYHQSFKGVYARIRLRHKRRWNNSLMTFTDFLEITSLPCIYCNDKANKGIDRVDNLIGYTKENSVSCCLNCNLMKRLNSKDKFLLQVEKIYENCFGHSIK